MTVLIFLAACFFTIVMGVMMVLPFFQQREDQIKFEVLDEDLKEIEALMQKKAIHVQQLMEIEDDLQAEKLTPADHAQLKRRYEREIILIMRRLDDIHGGQGWQERVQRARHAHLGLEPLTEQAPSTTIEPTSPQADDEQRQLIEEDLEGQGKDVLLDASTLEHARCQTCDHPLSSSDRFCAQCGTPVPDAPSTTTTSLSTPAQEPPHTEDEVTTP